MLLLILLLRIWSYWPHPFLAVLQPLDTVQRGSDWRVHLDLILLPIHHLQVCLSSGTSCTTHQPHGYFPFHSWVIFIFCRFSHLPIPGPSHVTSWNEPLAAFYLRDIFKLPSIQNYFYSKNEWVRSLVVLILILVLTEGFREYVYFGFPELVSERQR